MRFDSFYANSACKLIRFDQIRIQHPKFQIRILNSNFVVDSIQFHSILLDSTQTQANSHLFSRNQTSHFAILKFDSRICILEF